jgi:hypothetical protein
MFAKAKEKWKIQLLELEKKKKGVLKVVCEHCGLLLDPVLLRLLDLDLQLQRQRCSRLVRFSKQKKIFWLQNALPR